VDKIQTLKVAARLVCYLVEGSSGGQALKPEERKKGMWGGNGESSPLVES